MKKELMNQMLALVAMGLPMVGAVEDVEMEVKKVAVFKNGYSQVSLEGEIGSGETQLRLRDVPVPVLGSFWWEAPEGVSVREVRSESAIVQAPKAQYSTLDFLLANVGLQAEVVMSNGAKLTGVICAPPAVEAASSFRPCHYTEPQGRPGVGSVRGGGGIEPAAMSAETTAVQLRMPSGVVTLKEAHILYAQVLSENPQYPTQTRVEPSLVFELSGAAAGKTLQVSSLSRGLSWLPSYRLDLRSQGKAQFECKAMVMNELTDLNGVQLELVMGYPALGKYLLPSPVAQFHSLDKFLGLIMRGNESGGGVLSQNFVSNNNYGYVAEQAPEQSGLTQAEDLFFYSIPDFSCAAGQTVTREIFGGEVNYSHVYTWHVPTQIEIRRWQNNHQSGYGSNGESPADVWHCVRVLNSLKAPWTTGVLDCYAEGRLVGRSQVNFTAEGASALVRLNKTMQAPVQYSETVQSREGVVLRMVGSLSITNHTAKEMKVVITKDVDGTPLSASDNGTMTCTPDFGDNPDGTFRWEVTVAAGEEKSVKYEYAHRE